MIKLSKILNEEVENYFKNNPYSLKDELTLINEIILSELLDPNNYYDYKGKKGLYTYKDINNVTFFVRLTYQPVNPPHFEFKTGWINDEGKPQYEPSIPPISPKSSAVDWDKRSNTVAKIYRDELLPFFENQDLTNIIVIKPISRSRMLFAERLVKKFTSEEKYNIEYGSPIIITKKHE